MHKGIQKQAFGFTLIELIIAMALFAFVSVAMAGALISVMDANKKSRNLAHVIDEFNFALDSMTRELRVGSQYNCGATAAPPIVNDGDSCGSIGFRTSEGRYYEYRFNAGEGSLERCGSALGDCDGVTYQNLTGSQVTITDADFYVLGTEPASDDEQPRVLIVIDGFAGDDPDTSADFTIQTTVTQRVPDL